MMRLGAGEALARLSTFGLYAYISRAFGVEVLGIVALSQTIAAYVIIGTDQGLRLIAARLVAQDAGVVPLIIRAVVIKRLISCAICVCLSSAYAIWGPVPRESRLYVLGIVLAVIPYAFSLDWLAWGLNRLGWLGFWRAIVGLSFMTIAILAMHFSGSPLLPIVVGNAVSVIIGAVLLWLLWRYRWAPTVETATTNVSDVQAQLLWRAVLPLGAATILTLVFHNFDTVMLAAMSTIEQVGRYSAAYKILFGIFGGYYLFTQSLYPKLAKMQAGRLKGRLLKALFAVAGLGTGIALVLSFWSVPILKLMYGSDLHATHLLRILSAAVPMDFCCALMGIVCVSRGFDTVVLRGAGFAAFANIFANLLLIPRLSATGAAWSTLISYVILLSYLAWEISRRAILEESASSLNTEMTRTMA